MQEQGIQGSRKTHKRSNNSWILLKILNIFYQHWWSRTRKEGVSEKKENGRLQPLLVLGSFLIEFLQTFPDLGEAPSTRLAMKNVGVEKNTLKNMKVSLFLIIPNGKNQNMNKKMQTTNQIWRVTLTLSLDDFAVTQRGRKTRTSGLADIFLHDERTLPRAGVVAAWDPEYAVA